VVAGAELLRRTPPAPDPALLDAFELTDPEQAAWWRDRLARVVRALAG
jgi:o-succinylbenzoate synthase